MQHSKLIIRCILLLLGFTPALVQSSSINGASLTGEHIRVQLLTQNQVVIAGKQQWLGFLLEPEPGWHVYWKNPGDSGEPLKLRWQVPSTLSIGDIQWPVPTEFPVRGLVNYGYERVLLMLPVNLDPSLLAGQEIPLGVKLSWLVCKESCIPGWGEMKLTLKVGEAEKPGLHAALFRETRGSLPRPLTLIGGSWQRTADTVSFTLYATQAVFKDVKKLSLFMATENVVEYAKPMDLSWQNNRLQAVMTLNSTYAGYEGPLEFVLATEKNIAWQTQLPFEKAE